MYPLVYNIQLKGYKCKYQIKIAKEIKIKDKNTSKNKVVKIKSKNKDIVKIGQHITKHVAQSSNVVQINRGDTLSVGPS